MKAPAMSDDAFRGRVPRTAVHPRARFPRTLRAPSPEEAGRGVAVAYSSANFMVYRAIVDRLSAGERFRVETRRGAYEIPAERFALAFPGIAASRSYREGSDSMPNACYYVQEPPPDEAEQFLVR